MPLSSYGYRCKWRERRISPETLCNETIAQFPHVFQPYLFTAKTVKEHLTKSWKNGPWAETVAIFSCATALQCTIVTYSNKSQNWLKFELRAKVPAKIANNQSCFCAVTLVLHDLNAETNHFNLLQPDEDCRLAPKPEIISKGLLWIWLMMNKSFKYPFRFYVNNQTKLIIRHPKEKEKLLLESDQNGKTVARKFKQGFEDWEH